MVAKKKATEVAKVAEEIEETPVVEVKATKVETEGKTARKPKSVKDEPKFTKTKLVGSKRFEGNRDVLRAVLKDGETYTISECEVLIDKFLKG